MHDTPRIIRMPRVLYLLGLLPDPEDRRKIAGARSTFYRRYRHNPDFPRPVDLPDGALAYFEDEVAAYLSSRGHTDDPRASVHQLPEHWEAA